MTLVDLETEKSDGDEDNGIIKEEEDDDIVCIGPVPKNLAEDEDDAECNEPNATMILF